MRHFVDLKDFDSDRLQAMLETAAQMKSGTDKSQPLAWLPLSEVRAAVQHDQTFRCSDAG